MKTPPPVVMDAEYHTEERILPYRKDEIEPRFHTQCLRVDMRIVWDESLDVIVVAREAPSESTDKMEQFAKMRAKVQALADHIVEATSQ